jgi:hypothetical protein
MAREVDCFFYGSFMNPKVMEKADHVLGEWQVATLPGYELRIAPHANLVRSSGAVAFGILTALNHAKLDQLYAGQSRGELYQPEAVLVQTATGFRPAMCYLVTDMKPGTASADYVEMIAEPAEAYGFPAWYVERMRGFAA